MILKTLALAVVLLQDPPLEARLEEQCKRFESENPGERDAAQVELGLLAWKDAARGLRWIEAKLAASPGAEAAGRLRQTLAQLNGGRWRMLPACPLDGRLSYASAVVGNKVMIWGGFSCKSGRPQFFSDGAVLDLEAWSWTRMSASPIRPCRLALARAFGGKVLVIGGDENAEPGDTAGFADTAWYDPAQDSWQKLEDCPILTRWRRVVWTDRGLVVWQEPNGDREFAGAVFEASTGRWTPMKPIPLSPRRHTAAALIGTTVVVWGGESVPGTSRLADGARYDVTRNEWTAMARSSLSPRSWADATPLGSHVIVMGGFPGGGGREKEHRDGALYDPARDTWSPLPEAPQFPEVYDSSRCGDKSLLMWGEDGCALYTLGETAWRVLPKVPCPVGSVRRRLVRVENRVLLGGCEGDVLTGAWFDLSGPAWHPIPRLEMHRECTVTPRGLLLWGGGDTGYLKGEIPCPAHNDGAFLEIPQEP